MYKKKFLLCNALICSIMSHTLSSNITPSNYKEHIKQLVKNNPHQLSIAEYELIAKQLLTKSPCKMLIFGVGNDSELWVNLNRNGLTVFLENNTEWLNKIRKQVPQLQAHLVHYKHTRQEWAELLSKLDKNALLMQLPPSIFSTKWDIIFVDAPEGWSDQNPGRMTSIFTAAFLAQNSGNTHVFVHDCNRSIEDIYSTIFLKSKNLKQSVDRLRHYHIS